MTLRARLLTLAVGILALLGGVAGSAAARSRVVSVPRLRGNVTRAYVTLHRDGLRVSIPHRFTLRNDAVTVVTASAPEAGRRVRRGSTVTLMVRCCRRLRHPAMTAAKSTLIPNVVGSGLNVVRSWALGSGRRYRVNLAALRGASGSSLLADYVTVRQSPSPNAVLGGTSPLIVSARQGHEAPCVAPLYAKTVAQDTQAIVFATPYVQAGAAYGTYYDGCIRQTGLRHRLDTTLTESGSSHTLSSFSIAGTELAAVGVDGGANSGLDTPNTFSVQSYDLNTGNSRTVYPAQKAFIDHLVINPAGLTGWHEIVSPVSTSTALSSVSCPITTFCAAVDSAGSVFTATDPAGGRGAWSQTTLTTAGLRSVSCPTTGLCVAAAAGAVYVSSNPAGGAPAWTQISIPGTSLQSVACPSVKLCVAVGGNGIVTSTDPTGGSAAWTLGTVAAQGLDDVACPSTSECVAGDGASGNLLFTTSPGTGASAWSTADINGDHALAAVGCASVSLCLTGDYSGDVLSSTNPSGGLPAWQLNHIASANFTAFSCPTTTLCVASIGAGVATTSQPTGGSRAWSLTPIAPAGFINGLSCPTTGLCVAVGSGGQITTSTNPSAGSSAWNAVTVDAPACAASGGCRIEEILAHDMAGTHTFDTTGPGDGTQLQGLTLTDNQLTWTHDGTAQSTTLG